MVKDFDIQFVRETYKKLTDQELVRIAIYDAKGLTPEAQQIVVDEIKLRGLDSNLVKGVEVQNKIPTNEELDLYCDIISRLNCPVCGSNAQPLNATVTGEVMSFIFITQYKKAFKIGCPYCLDMAIEKALTKTALLGWWGIPWGVIRTIQYIRLNIKNKRTNHSDSHNDFLRSFVLTKIGALEANKNNKENLQQLVASF